MRITRSKESGGALLVVLCTSVVIGITLASYLQYTATQSKSIMHSQVWNASIPVAEAGVEEALAHINDSTTGTNYALNGWTVVDGQFQKSGTVAGGRYVTRISTDALPVITSTGYTTDGRTTNELSRTVQVTTTHFSTGVKGLITKGDVTMVGITKMDSFDSEDPAYSTRGRYDAAKHKDGGYTASVYGNVYASVVYGSVGTGPNGTATGTVGDFAWTGSSTGIEPGHYANDVNLAFPIVQPPFDGGATTLSSLSSQQVTLTNFSYWSTMVTDTNPPASTPASPVTTNTTGLYTLTWPSYPSGVSSSLITTQYLTVTEKKNATDPNWSQVVGGQAGVTTSGAYRTYTLIKGYTYPTLTYTYSMTASNNTATTDTYDYVLTGDRYQTDTLKLDGSSKLLVLGTNVTLYVTRDFSMSGNSQVIVAPGASIKMYVAGDMSLSGNGVYNYTLDATHMSMFGLPSSKNISISGNASFTGVLYAPQADITMNGSGTTIYDVVGAITGNTAKLNGQFQFHYDERLGRSRVQAKFQVASWLEI